MFPDFQEIQHGLAPVGLQRQSPFSNLRRGEQCLLQGLPSVATTLPEAELTESQYRGILMTNVKLWKYSQADEASVSSDFSDQEDDV